MEKIRRILITGATGSLGKELIKKIFKNHRENLERLVVFSRDELKQWELRNLYPEDKFPELRFFLGDIRDKDRLRLALNSVDIVVHTAALKQVPAAEYNPIEFIKTNIVGSQNLIEACFYSEVKKVIALSTDKACSPVNLYGATKLCSDKLFVASNNFLGDRQLSFSVVRYGNVMGSRGSIIPYFKSLSKKEAFPITDLKMTRFFLSLEDAVELVWLSLNKMIGGEIFVKKIPSILITDIAKAINPNAKYKIIGIRPGEKIHEELISADDSRFTYDFDKYYKILPSLTKNILSYKKGGFKVKSDFSYSSNNNSEWLNVKKITQIIEKN